MTDQDNYFYLISLSVLITFLMDNVWMLWGEVTCQSLPVVKGLITTPLPPPLAKMQGDIKLNKIQSKHKME